MKRRCREKSCYCEFSKKEQYAYDIGFDDGYKTASRIYKPRHITIFNEDFERLTTKII